jgi:hypothetical protein
MAYSHILEGFKTSPREVVENEINKLQKLNYNRFFWWRNFAVKQKPLHKYCPLIDKIKNGDFNPSPYMWMAQYAILEAYPKINPEKDDPVKQSELLVMDIARYRRLMADFEKDEKERISNLYREFKINFRLDEETVQNEMMDFDGTLEEFYHYIRKKYRENNKSLGDFS